MPEGRELILYVVRSDGNPATLQVLERLHREVADVNAGDIFFTIIPLLPREMKDAAVQEELSDFGVERLPALVDATGEECLAEGGRKVSELIGRIAQNIRNEKKQREQSGGALKRRAATGNANVYHDWVAQNIGEPGRGDEDERDSSESLSADTMRASMSAFMNRRKELGMDKPQQGHQDQGHQDRGPSGGKSRAQSGGGRKGAVRRGAEVDAPAPRKKKSKEDSGDRIMDSVGRASGKMDSADAMMTAALFGNMETS